MADNLIPPSGYSTPEQEEELRAYGRAMGGMDLGQTRDLMGAGSPWRVLLGALRGIQSKSAIEGAESSRVRRRASISRSLPGVSSLNPQPPPSTTLPTAPPTTLPDPSTAPPSVDTSGLHPRFIRALTQIESSDNPNAVAPSGLYRGLGQFSRDLEQRYGIVDWTNRQQQERAIALHAQNNRRILEQRLGRPVRDGELYLAHQQGAGGAVALLSSPGETAFDVLMRLPYYQNKANPAYAVQTAIMNNLPAHLRRRWRSITAGEFAGQWVSRFETALGRVPVNAPGAPNANANAGAFISADERTGDQALAVGAPGITSPLTLGAAGLTPPGMPPPPGAPEIPGSIRGALPPGTSDPETIQTGQIGASLAPPSVGDVDTSETPPPGIGPPPVSDVGQPGYFAGGQLPPNVPQRIQVDPALISVLQRLRNYSSMSEEQYNKALEEYQRLVAPKSVTTTFGTAIYNPLTGELMDFVPGPIARRPVSVPGVQTDQLLAPNTSGGFNVVPTTPAPGGGGVAGVGAVSASASASGPPNLTARLPPLGGDIHEMSTWGMRAEAIRGMITKMGESHTGRVAAAAQAGTRAAERINMLQTIAALTDASRASRWVGETASQWRVQLSQFLINFDPRHRGQRPEALQNLPYQELLLKLNAFLASEATQDISARGTNFEFATLLRYNPNLSSSYEGTMMLLSYMQQEQEHVRQLAEMATQLHPDQFPNWSRIVAEYYRENPVIIEVPPTTGANGQRSPPMRITTAPIPRVGSIRPDGQSTWTRQQVLEYIQTLPPDLWFIDPVSRRPVPVRPRSNTGQGGG